MFLRAQVDPDAWWHIRVGAETVASGRVPVVDTLSWWSAGTPWISPSWLNEVLLYFFDQVAGPAGQSLLYLPVYLAIVVLADRLIALNAPTLPAPWRLVILAVMAISLLPVIAPRAGTFDLLFSLFAIYGWLRYRQSGSTRWLWLMPVAAVLWANLHGGGVMVYFALALAFAVGTFVDRRRFPDWRWAPFAASLVLTYLALGVNPYGTALYVYPWSTLFSSAQTTTIAEWRSPDFGSLGMFGVRLLVALGLAVGLARARMSDAAGAFSAGGMLFLALGAARYLVIAVPVLAIWFVPSMLSGAARYIQSAMPGWRPRIPPGYAQLAVVGPVLIVGAIISSGALPAGQEQMLAARYPSTTLDALSRCGVERVWTDYGYGGWTAYRTGWLIGPYGAADSLGDERLLTAAAVEGVTTDPGGVFDALGVDSVLTESGRPLAFWLSANPAWRVVATDAVATAAVREGTPC